MTSLVHVQSIGIFGTNHIWLKFWHEMVILKWVKDIWLVQKDTKGQLTCYLTSGFVKWEIHKTSCNKYTTRSLFVIIFCLFFVLSKGMQFAKKYIIEILNFCTNRLTGCKCQHCMSKHIFSKTKTSTRKSLPAKQFERQNEIFTSGLMLLFNRSFSITGQDDCNTNDKTYSRRSWKTNRLITLHRSILTPSS